MENRVHWSERTSDVFARSDWTREPRGRTRRRDDVVAGAHDPRWRGPLSEFQRNRVAGRQFTAAMGDWVIGLAQWDWFGTYTFARPVSAAGAHYIFRRYFDWLEQRCDMSLFAFRADEYGALNGRFHLHALVSHHGQRRFGSFCGQRLPAGSGRRQCCAQHGWPAGYARVFEVDPDRVNSKTKRGAPYYVAKYVCKSNGDWDLYGFDHLLCPF